MRAYVVIGSSGYFEDEQEWFVAAYDEEGGAKEHVRLAQATFDDLQKKFGRNKRIDEINPYDPQMYHVLVVVPWNDPVTYRYEVVPLFHSVSDAVKAFKENK